MSELAILKKFGSTFQLLKAIKQAKLAHEDGLVREFLTAMVVVLERIETDKFTRKYFFYDLEKDCWRAEDAWIPLTAEERKISYVTYLWQQLNEAKMAIDLVKNGDDQREVKDNFTPELKELAKKNRLAIERLMQPQEK